MVEPGRHLAPFVVAKGPQGHLDRLCKHHVHLSSLSILLTSVSQLLRECSRRPPWASRRSRNGVSNGAWKALIPCRWRTVRCKEPAKSLGRHFTGNHWRKFPPDG